MGSPPTGLRWLTFWTSQTPEARWSYELRCTEAASRRVGRGRRPTRRDETPAAGRNGGGREREVAPRRLRGLRREEKGLRADRSSCGQGGFSHGRGADRYTLGVARV